MATSSFRGIVIAVTARHPTLICNHQLLPIALRNCCQKHVAPLALESARSARPWTILAIREIGNTTEIHYAVSNAPAEKPLAQLVRIQRQRFWIEHASRDAKGQLGLADYQARAWNGWYLHVTLCAIALTFLVKERRDHQ